MSRALVEDQLSLDAAGIPHLNEESAFVATIRWGSGDSMDLKFDPIHEQLMLRWQSEGTSCQRTRGLAYYSQPLSRSDRPMLRAQRSQRKLGSDDGMGEPEKPNGMHWTTYSRLLDRADELDERGWMSALGGLRWSAG
jgi:hypothetical protein